ncbi:MAG: asparagine synthase-related protein, partial [Acidobacteriota bacterium]|nr:asparagine synthase-related protein [Acidobacteriota bacterium]
RKHVLKKAMAELLPASVLNRGKEGFSIPMKQWLRDAWAPLMQDLLSPTRVERRGWLEPAEVTRLVDEHRSGRENHAHILFCLMSFEHWAERFLD